MPTHGSCAPRVCGDDPEALKLCPFALLVLPAYAGMILPREADRRTVEGAPRVCGDDPSSGEIASVLNHVLPAYAGMILRASLMSGSNKRCSPRMRG